MKRWKNEQNNRKNGFLNKKTSIFFLKKSSQKRLQLIKVWYKYPHRKEEKSIFLKKILAKRKQENRKIFY